MRYRAESDPTLHVAHVALLLACAVGLSYIEAVVVPALPVPGVRLGIGNVAVIVALAWFGPREAGVVAMGRALLVGLATGTLISPVGAMSFAGSLSSWMVMSALWSAGSRFTPLGWSVAGAATHVGAQLMVASVLIGTSAVLVFVPLSLSLAVPTGLAVGLVARTLLSRISRPVWSLSGA